MREGRRKSRLSSSSSRSSSSFSGDTLVLSPGSQRNSTLSKPLDQGSESEYDSSSDYSEISGIDICTDDEIGSDGEDDRYTPAQDETYYQKGCQEPECCLVIREWRIWSWFRRRSVYLVTFLASLAMIAAGATGIVDAWAFCSVDGYDLGGLGYCFGGKCTIKPFYHAQLHTSEMFKTTPFLSTFLLAVSGIGGMTILFLLCLWWSAEWGNGDFQPPHRVILYCCFQTLPPNRRMRRKELRQLAKDNGKGDFEWSGSAEDQEMLDHVRRKNCFEQYMWWFFWPSSLTLGALTFAWVSAVDAEELLPFDLFIYGGMACFVLYCLCVRSYRLSENGESARQKALSNAKTLEEENRDKEIKIRNKKRKKAAQKRQDRKLASRIQREESPTLVKKKRGQNGDEV